MVAPYMTIVLLYLAIFVIMTYRSRKTMPTLSKISIVTALAMLVLFVYAYIKLGHVAGHIHYLLYENFASDMSKAAIYYHSTFMGPKAGQLAELLRPGIIDPISDFAFTSIIVWYGYFAAAALLVLYVWVARRLNRNIKTTQDPFYALLNTGTLALFLLYLFFSLTTSFGIFPIASYLPLVSYSPVRLIAFCALFGFIFSEKGR